MNDDIQKAKETLRDAGYYVDNLWQVNDVKVILEVAEDDELCYEILDSVMGNGYLVSHIFGLIKNEGLDREISLVN